MSMEIDFTNRYSMLKKKVNILKRKEYKDITLQGLMMCFRRRNSVQNCLKSYSSD